MAVINKKNLRAPSGVVYMRTVTVDAGGLFAISLPEEMVLFIGEEHVSSKTLKEAYIKESEAFASYCNAITKKYKVINIEFSNRSLLGRSGWGCLFSATVFNVEEVSSGDNTSYTLIHNKYLCGKNLRQTPFIRTIPTAESGYHPYTPELEAMILDIAKVTELLRKNLNNLLGTKAGELALDYNPQTLLEQ